MPDRPLSLSVRKNNFGKNRFYFVVSRAVSKKATVRNLLKRRARAVVQKKMNKLSGGRDFLFIFSKGAEKLSFAELNELFDGILKNIIS